MSDQWIDVRDRLPPDFYGVFVWIVNDRIGEDSIDVGVYNKKLNQWLVNEGDDDIVVNVSHWLSVPGPWFKMSERRPQIHPDVEVDPHGDQWRYSGSDDCCYTSKKPRVPGWYWCMNPSDNSEFLCRVDHHPNAPGLFCSWMTAPGEAGLMHESEWSKTVSWCGPLVSPFDGRLH